MLLRQHATAEGCFSATLSERFTEPFLHSQVETGEDGLGAEMEHGVHLARHREAALLAAARIATYRYHHYTVFTLCRGEKTSVAKKPTILT